MASQPEDMTTRSSSAPPATGATSSTDAAPALLKDAASPSQAKTGAVHPLDELRDIHLPPQPQAWPPAPGWWAVGTGLGIVLLLALVLRKSWLARRELRRMLSDARTRLRDIESRYQSGADLPALAADLSVLVRRVALSVHPRRDVAGLHGTAWLDYLARQADEDGFRGAAGRVLTEAPFRDHASQEWASDFEACMKLVDTWLARIARGPQSED